jgi:LuxR family maltose regulon positive regulatory protein
VCYFEQARLLQALGEPEAAVKVIHKAKDLTGTLSPFARRSAEKEEAVLWLRQGNLQAASDWRKTSGLSAHGEIRLPIRSFYGVLARVLLAEGNAADGLPLLERLLAIEEDIGEGEQVIHLLVLLARVLYQLGQVDRAVPVLEKSLALAEPEGFVRPYLDEGRPMEDLLRYAVDHSRITDPRLAEAAVRLLSAF